MNQDYLFVSRKLKNTTVRICLFDTLKSKKGIIKFYLKKIIYKIYFDKMWGTGRVHSEYALSLGYKRQNILKNFMWLKKFILRIKLK